jgi:phosphatidylglycerol:prolipoprotein diacylglycerol transferase
MKLNFSPELLRIHGSLGIQSYGLFILLGIIIATIAARYNKRFTQLHLEKTYFDIIAVGVIAGVIGGRLLVIISEPFLYRHIYDWFALWQGGFSILGTIIGVIITLPFYLKKINVPIIPFADLVAIYAPLCQSIARLGCFFAGCCYGITTNNIFAVTYTNPQTFAPCNISLHPTQLYSSALLFGIFIFMYFIGQRICKKNGELFIMYLTLACLERFFVDFWRADRIMIDNHISFHQIVALCIIIFLIIFYYCLSIKNTKK